MNRDEQVKHVGNVILHDHITGKEIQICGNLNPEHGEGPSFQFVACANPESRKETDRHWRITVKIEEIKGV